MSTFSNLALLLHCNSISSIWYFCGTSLALTEKGLPKIVKSVSRSSKAEYLSSNAIGIYTNSSFWTEEVVTVIYLNSQVVMSRYDYKINVTLLWHNNKSNSVRPNVNTKLAWRWPQNWAWRAGFGPLAASLTPLL